MQVDLVLFYDVLCERCLHVADVLVQLQQAYGEQLHVHYRLCSPTPTPEDIRFLFGIVQDDADEFMGHRILYDEPQPNPGVRTGPSSLSYPASQTLPALRGIKAAELQSGPAGHMQMHTRLYIAQQLEKMNVADPEVVMACAADIGLDLPRFHDDFNSQVSLAALIDDRAYAQTRGVFVTPSVLIAGRWLVVEAVDEAVYCTYIDLLLGGHDEEG